MNDPPVANKLKIQYGPSHSQQHFTNGDYSPRKTNFAPQSRPRTSNKSEQTASSNSLQASIRPTENFDQSYLSPYKVGTRPPFSQSRSGSEADSLIDLYGHPRSLSERSPPNSMDKDRPIPHEELYLDEEDPERSRWIHRDKLAIIESHEMQEAGINLPPQPKRSMSKAKKRREQSQSEDNPELPQPALNQDEEAPSLESKKQRTRSPVRDESAVNGTSYNEFDIRTPEEIAADKYTELNQYHHQDLRKSSSRIPLPRSSPMPIPQEHIERDQPLPRKRGASGNWTGDENDISYNRIRSRQNSIASQGLLDDPEAIYNTPTQTSRPVSRGSPSKVRNFSINSNQPIPHSRNPSLTSPNDNAIHAQHPYKPRSTSTTNSPRTPSNPRPKSRSGLEPRPSTAVNRPEGEAPWLATMYKPDPRLPPDQQLLPTHAKRLQQEQWEKARKDSEQRQQRDGKPIAQPAKEFSPLAEYTVNGLQPSDKDRDEPALQQSDISGEWPLPIPPPTSSPLHQQRDRSPGLPPANGGYSPMPKVKPGDGSPVRQQQYQTQQQPPQTGLRHQRPLDPFENEKLEREAVSGPKDVEKADNGNGKDGKDDKEGGCCGRCVIM